VRKPQEGTRLVNEQDRAKRRALLVLQLVIYGYLALMIVIQLRLWSQRGW